MNQPSPRMHRPFLFFVALAVLFLAAFGGWSFAVFTGDAIVQFDQKMAEACAERSPDQPALRMLMFVATSSGGVRANLIIALGGAFWMWHHHRRRFAFAWLVIAAIGGLMDLGFKDLFDRARPPVEIRDEAAAHLTNPSYPSGHAMGSVVGYGMLGFVLVQRAKGVSRRLAIGVVLALWVALIGLSRVYLRAHWSSDVVGGWLLGLGYMNACLAIYFWRSAAVKSPSAAAAP
jgi:undecaprenyl-diphosphatase